MVTEGSILDRQATDVFSEWMIVEQRPERSERVSQKDIGQKKVRAKGTASFCLGTGTHLLVQEQGGGKCDKGRVVGKGQIIQGLIGHI